MDHFFYGRSVKGTWSGLPDWGSKRICKKVLENGITLCEGLVLKPGMGLIYQGLTCIRRLWRLVFLSIGAPLGNAGCPSTRKFGRLLQGCGNGGSITMGALVGKPEVGFLYWGP